MTAVYVDTSVLVAVRFREPKGKPLRSRLAAFDRQISTALVVSELLAVFRREALPLCGVDAILSTLDLYVPDTPLRAECEEVFEAGHVRGADAWHLASALALAGRRHRSTLTFATLDTNQAKVARTLGFTVIPAAARA